MTAVSLDTVPVNCWNAIGVAGDGSCPELAEHTHCRNCPVFAAAGQRLFDRPPPPGYADEWAAALARAEPAAGGRTVPVVLFRVADEWLALDVGLAVEVAPVRVVRRIPHQTDRVLAGLVNIRGELQPAFSLQLLMGLSETDAPTDPHRRRLMVAEKDGQRWVFVVDEVADVRHLPEADLGGVPTTVGGGPAVLTRGVFRWAGRAVGYLDADRLFAELKRSYR
jgi:chemotaxis-related protein WspD